MFCILLLDSVQEVFFFFLVAGNKNSKQLILSKNKLLYCVSEYSNPRLRDSFMLGYNWRYENWSLSTLLFSVLASHLRRLFPWRSRNGWTLIDLVQVYIILSLGISGKSSGETDQPSLHLVHILASRLRLEGWCNLIGRLPGLRVHPLVQARLWGRGRTVSKMRLWWWISTGKDIKTLYYRISSDENINALLDSLSLNPSILVGWACLCTYLSAVPLQDLEGSAALSLRKVRLTQGAQGA